jgi:hypothetical protein
LKDLSWNGRFFFILKLIFSNNFEKCFNQILYIIQVEFYVLGFFAGSLRPYINISDEGSVFFLNPVTHRAIKVAFIFMKRPEKTNIIEIEAEGSNLIEFAINF